MKKLEKVTFNSQITNFEDKCFERCEKLNLKIPETIEYIGVFSIAQLANEELLIPESCGYVNMYVFYCMKNLRYVTIKNPETQINPTAFDGVHQPKNGQNRGNRVSRGPYKQPAGNLSGHKACA